MGTYAASTSVSIDRSRAEIEHTLIRYGATSFVYGWEEGHRRIHRQPETSGLLTRTSAVSRTVRYLSPLRYPGGKARMSTFLADTFIRQSGPMDIEVWVEPFAGGAGAGLTLLDQGVVSELWLTESNPALAALWRVIASDGHRFADLVAHTVPDLSVWGNARELIAANAAGEDVNDPDLAFAAFILNRCSRSGMVNPAVGPIGGKNQTGRWSLQSRFNGPALADRIRRVADFGDAVRIGEGDAIDRIADLAGSGVEHEVFLFVDPPYIREGNRLYAQGMTMGDHERLAEALHGCPSPWVLTYDDEPCVHQTLYPGMRVLEYEIPHTANRQRIDREYAVLSDNLVIGAAPAVLPKGSTRLQ